MQLQEEAAGCESYLLQTAVVQISLGWPYRIPDSMGGPGRLSDASSPLGVATSRNSDVFWSDALSDNREQIRMRCAVALLCLSL